MSYSTPPHIRNAAVDSLELRYRWDDWKASEEFRHPVPEAIGSLTEVVPRARVALGIGVYEWIIARFRRVSDDPGPADLAEAAWCGCVDRRYLLETEFTREEWLGPIRGPLWCAATWLVPMVLAGEADPEEVDSGLAYLPRLALHVLPDATPFMGWLEAAVARMVRFYPLPSVDPFEDLFGEREEGRRGPLVPQEVLDPGYGFRPEDATMLVEQFLRSVDPRRNPYLRSAADMRRAGFEGRAYG